MLASVNVPVIRAPFAGWPAALGNGTITPPAVPGLVIRWMREALTGPMSPFAVTVYVVVVPSFTSVAVPVALGAFVTGGNSPAAVSAAPDASRGRFWVMFLAA